MGKPKKLRKLIKAAKMGKPHAMFRLGIYFETGTMTEKNTEKPHSGFPPLPNRVIRRHLNG